MGYGDWNIFLCERFGIDVTISIMVLQMINTWRLREA